MSAPTLSILVPHYNDPDGLALSLRSFEAQTWKGTREVVVCDDGSTPENLERAQQIAAASSETVRLIPNRVNRGRPYTRNVLLDAAEGRYITWCDAGDEYYPRKIEAQLDGLYHARYRQYQGVIWSTCNSDWQWAGSERKKLVVQEVEGDQVGNLLTDRMRAYLYTLLGTAQSFRDVGYFDLELPRLQDLDFFLRFVSRGGLIILPRTAEPLCLYHKTDVGRAGQEVLQCFERIYQKHSPLMMQRSRRFRRNRQFKLYQHVARFTQNNKDYARTVLYLGASAVTHPVAFGKWLIKNKGQL